MTDRTPAVTPGDTVGASTVLAFLALAVAADVPESVQLASVIGAVLVALVTVYSHGQLRIVRNARAVAELKG